MRPVNTYPMGRGRGATPPNKPHQQQVKVCVTLFTVAGHLSQVILLMSQKTQFTLLLVLNKLTDKARHCHTQLWTHSIRESPSAHFADLKLKCHGGTLKCQKSICFQNNLDRHFASCGHEFFGRTSERNRKVKRSTQNSLKTNFIRS